MKQGEHKWIVAAIIPPNDFVYKCDHCGHINYDKHEYVPMLPLAIELVEFANELGLSAEHVEKINSILGVPG